MDATMTTPLHARMLSTHTVDADADGQAITYPPELAARAKVLLSFHGDHTQDVQLAMDAGATTYDVVKSGEQVRSGPYVLQNAPTHLVASATTSTTLTIYEILN